MRRRETLPPMMPRDPLAEFGALCERDMHYARLLDERMVQIARDNPDIILEACVFEIVSREVEGLAVPDWAFKALGRPAERRRREAVVLYDVVRLMQAPDLHESLVAVAERLRDELELAAAVVDFGQGAPLAIQAEAGEEEALQIARLSSLPSSKILVQGTAAKSPSLLTGPTQVFRQYANVSGFSQAIHARAVSNSSMFGQTIVKIDYQNYQVQLGPPA